MRVDLRTSCCTRYAFQRRTRACLQHISRRSVWRDTTHCTRLRKAADSFLLGMLRPEEPWTSGLFGCCSDIGTCCFGAWCLPCLYGKNASKLRSTSCSGPGCSYACCPCFICMFAGNLRGEVRTKYNLPSEPCADCCVHLCCSPCAVCQEAREIKHRGIAPAGAYTFSDPQITVPMRQNMA